MIRDGTPQSPDLVQKEFFMHLIGANLIGAVMVETARQHEVPMERLSFNRHPAPASHRHRRRHVTPA